MSLYSEIKTSTFLALPILTNSHNIQAYNRTKSIVENVDELCLSFSRTTSTHLDCRYVHFQTKYLYKNGNSLIEMKYRIRKYGDIFNYVDFTSQTNDKAFLPRIRNLQKIMKKILNGTNLVWTERDLFLEYTKFPRACFVVDNYEWKFVPVIHNTEAYTIHNCRTINSYINVMIGEE